MEFGNPLCQGLIDGHVTRRRSTDRLDASRLAEYDAVLVWDSRLYQQFYEPVRALTPSARPLVGCARPWPVGSMASIAGTVGRRRPCVDSRPGHDTEVAMRPAAAGKLRLEDG